MKKPKSIYFISIWTFLLFSFQKNTISLVLFGTTNLSNEMQMILISLIGLTAFFLILGLIKLNKVAVYILITLFVINNLSIFFNLFSNLSSVMNSKYGFAALIVAIFIFLANSVSIYFLVNHRFRLLIKKTYEERNKNKKLLKERSTNQSRIIVPKTNIQKGLGHFFTIFAGFILMGLLITPNILKRMDLISLSFAGIGSIVMFYFGRINLNIVQWKKLMKYLLIGLAAIIFIESMITLFNLLFVVNRLPHNTTGRVLWLLAMCALFVLTGMIIGDEESLNEQEVSH